MRKITNFCYYSVLLLLLSVTAAGQVPLQTTTFWQTTEKNVYSTGMIWRDCNNDGFIDVFFSNGNDMAKAANYIYLSNYGTLPTTASWASTNKEYSGHCAVGDINDDSFPDFAVANYIGTSGFSTMSFGNLYMNEGGNPHTSPDWYTADSIYSFSCAFGDPDADGRLDLAFAVGEGYYAKKMNNRIYYNVGGALPTLLGWQSTETAEAMDVAWGDVNNDGYLDLAFCYDDVPPRVYYNDGGVLQTSAGWEAANSEPANTLIWGDINKDGWLDLVVAFNNQNGGEGRFRVYYNDSTGHLQTNYGWQSADGGYGSALALYDYNNDGYDDLAAGRWYDKPRIYDNQSGSFTITPVWQAANSTVPEELAWVDIDGDGLENKADTFYIASSRKLFYTKHHPLYSIDSISVDGSLLDMAGYCYDLVSGWVSLGQTPVEKIVIYYQYSYKNDLTVANWNTYNMAYGNTRPPYVNFFADTTLGNAPLVVHFTDSSLDASDQFWRFGDGDNSFDIEPVHTFIDGGAFDITLANTVAGERHIRTKTKMIITFADTLIFPDITFDYGDTIKIPIYLKNCHPLRRFNLPIYHGGQMQLDYAGFDTDSCRTQYFDIVRLESYSSYESKLVFAFSPVTKADLAPGYGRIMNLYFVHKSGNGSNFLDSTTLSAKSLSYDARYIVYQPAVRSGLISSSFLAKGDVNRDGTVDILDIIYLIDYKFKNGPPCGLYEGDVTYDGKINLRDILRMISFLFKNDPPL